MSESILARISDGSKKIGPHLLWENVDCEVRAGEFIAIIGDNGVGKSTLLQCMLGLERLSSGKSWCTKDKAILSQLMPEIPVIPITPYELIRYSLQGNKIFTRNKNYSTSIAAIIQLCSLEAFAHQPINTLSGGQWQRVRIAAAMVSNPMLFGCDEPLRGLDPHNQEKILFNLQQWQHVTGASIVMVSHIHEHVLPRADRIFYITDRTLAVVTAEEITVQL